MNGRELFETILETVMCALEECFDAMVVAKGRKLFLIVCINFTFVLFAILARLLGWFTFISISEAVMGLALSIVITLSNSVNRKSVEKVAERLKRKENGYGR